MPEPDGVHEMSCPESSCSSVECHAWDSLVGRYRQASDASLNVWVLMPVALAVGLVEGVGTVVPGLSTSFILINLGWYQAYLDALAHPQAGLLALVALGFAASALVSMKAVQWLFDHARGYTCYAVLGFLLVSVALVFPGFGSGWTLWAQLAALLAGLLVARWMGGLGEPVATTSKG